MVLFPEIKVQIFKNITSPIISTVLLKYPGVMFMDGMKEDVQELHRVLDSISIDLDPRLENSSAVTLQ